MKVKFKVIAIQVVILAFTPLLSFCQNDVMKNDWANLKNTIQKIRNYLLLQLPKELFLWVIQ